MRPYGRVAVGGTFDRFHIGHEALLGMAFQLGRTVAIGLTSRTFLAAHPKPRGGSIAPEGARRRTLARWLGRNYPARRWTVAPLDERFGRSVEDGIDALVVSAETTRSGRAVNRERLRRGRRPIPLIVVPLVLADDLEPVSSRRIRSGEIDRRGHRRSRIRVGLVVGEGRDARPSVRGIRRAFPRATITVERAGGLAAVSRAGARRLAARAAGRRALGVSVTPVSPEGWLVAVRGPRARLDPRRVPGSSPRDLEEGLLHLLRPSA